jgi:hypothetical protein
MKQKKTVQKSEFHEMMAQERATREKKEKKGGR